MIEALIVLLVALFVAAAILIVRDQLARRKKRLRAEARAAQEKQRLAVTSDPRKRAKLIERNL